MTQLEKTPLEEWRGVAEWDWVGVGGDYLHAPGEVLIVDDPDGYGTTACGIKGRMWIPGLFTRMSAARCRVCCDEVGMPRGKGSPKNDEACREIAEKRASS